MVKALRRRRFAGLLVASILSILVVVWLFLPVRFLEIVDEQSGRRYGLFRVEEDARIRLSWIHSVERTPWVEQYRIRGTKLILTEVRVKSFGAGVDVEAPESKVEGGWVVMRKMDREFDALHFIYSRRAGHRLHLGNRDLDLKSRVPHHASVEVRIRKSPRISAIIE
ncbi:hypothetical protein CLV97_10116 [Planifilum fimeticola]|uniref:DUF1850 domain-containing protein n=1 Tax=Planifilum fimeticola TaxID=201975 RepID=A0A2T0LJ45_9BACL|nr:DUF1850 domain-containing protein [Planifilum fimeticola]PRX42528.1 hypothetical protein CLV97_10116 [Planifilum fimeticola]